MGEGLVTLIKEKKKSSAKPEPSTEEIFAKEGFRKIEQDIRVEHLEMNCPETRRWEIYYDRYRHYTDQLDITVGKYMKII